MQVANAVALAITTIYGVARWKVAARRGGRKWGEAAVWEKGKTEQNSRESDALCLDC